MAALYTVLYIREQTRLTVGGMYLKMNEIHAITTNGIEFTVELPKVGYSKEAAAALLEEEAKKYEDTLAL